MTETADIGVVGLGVMGQNLAMNLADHGFRVAVYNRNPDRTRELLVRSTADQEIVGTSDYAELAAALARPRKLLVMVTAGPAVDSVIGDLRPHLEPGDIIIDGGNSLFTDSQRRAGELESDGLRFVGAGISGGEEGARHGPSIMPGGTADAWPLLAPILQTIAARAPDGEPCCDWVGPDGAGHYVKMVHNGIEYGDMQLIAEAYHLMHAGHGMDHHAMAAVFKEWDEGPLDSFLIELTGRLLLVEDEDGGPLVESVLDAAGQKGTGKWTVISSMELGMPVSLIAEAVYARILSALKDERVRAANELGRVAKTPDWETVDVLADLHDALYAAKIASYAQGFMLLSAASEEYGWDIDLGLVASLWRAGCIIRSAFLSRITEAYRADPGLSNLLMAQFFREAMRAAESGWRRTVARAVEAGIPVPAYSSALAFWDGYRSARLPANLIQAQRDAFGSHTYERVDRERGELFHSDWDPAS